MDIVIKQLTKDYIKDINQFDETFTVDSVIQLKVEHEEICYTIHPIPPYTKMYPIEETDYDAFIDQEDQILYLALLNERVVGQITVQKAWNNYAYIDDLKVDRSLRGKGIGAQLMTQAIAWARAKGTPGLSLETQNNNVRACRFYEKMGFKIGGFDRFLYKGIKDHNFDEIAIYYYLLF